MSRGFSAYLLDCLVFLFLLHFKGPRKGVFDRIQANGLAIRIMKVQNPVFNKNLIFWSESPCVLIRVISLTVSHYV